MTVRNNGKDSDLSSDSSWTLINELETVSRTNSCANNEGSGVKDSTTKELLEKPLEMKANNENTELLGTNSKPAKNKNKKKRSNKQGTDHMHYLSIAACLLTITGITLLTTLLPPNYTESADIGSLQQHLKDVYEHTKNPSMENSISSVQAAIKAIEATRATDTLNIVSENIGDQAVCDALFPEYFNNSLTSDDDNSKLRIKIIAPYNEGLFENDNEINGPNDLIEVIQNTTMSMVQVAKNLIRSPTFQLLVATLVQDMCLIKLINEFSKRTCEESSSEVKENQQSTVKTNKTIRTLPGLSQKKNRKQEIKERKKNQSKNLKKTLALPANESHPETNQIPVNENGKSECERRFEELDGRWSILGQQHRQKIQEIKNRFQEEIFRINDIEKEGLNRKQKIRLTREKYIQKLKANREVYLHRLRKIREERHVVLKDVCQNSRNLKNLNSKDVSVGNFALLLSSDYDFPKKQESLKTEGNVRLETINNETFSYNPINNNNSLPCAEAIISEDGQRKNALIKKPKIMKKKQPETDANVVQEVVTNILDSLPENTPNHLDNNIFQESTSTPAVPIENTTDIEPFQLVRRRKTCKKNLNDLYDVAFDHQSKKIKEHDTTKWNKKFDTFKWTTSTDLMTRQDSQRNRRKRLLYKGLL